MFDLLWKNAQKLSAVCVSIVITLCIAFADPISVSATPLSVQYSVSKAEGIIDLIDKQTFDTGIDKTYVKNVIRHFIWESEFAPESGGKFPIKNADGGYKDHTAKDSVPDSINKTADGKPKYYQVTAKSAGCAMYGILLRRSVYGNPTIDPPKINKIGAAGGTADDVRKLLEENGQAGEVLRMEVKGTHSLVFLACADDGSAFYVLEYVGDKNATYGNQAVLLGKYTYSAFVKLYAGWSLKLNSGSKALNSKAPTTPATPQPPVAVTGISLPGAKTVTSASCFTLAPVFTPSNATDTKITWKSSNTSVATVDQNGEVTPIKNGEATITATSANGKSATSKVTVKFDSHTHAYDDGVCKVCGEVFPLKTTPVNATYYATADGVKAYPIPYSSKTTPLTSPGPFKKGEAVVVIESAKNAPGNLWYRIGNGQWVYSGSFTSTKPATSAPHTHSYDDGVCKVCGEIFPLKTTPVNATYYANADGVKVYPIPYSSKTTPLTSPGPFKKGEAVMVIESAKNAPGNLWYRIGENQWVYSGSFTTTNPVGTTPSPLATIRYDANGGTNPPASHSVTIGTDGGAYFNLSSTKPTRSGYMFLGWRLDDYSDYDIDQPGQSIAISVGNANTTLTYYAQWQAQAATPAPSIQQYTLVIKYITNSNEDSMVGEYALIDSTGTAYFNLSKYVPYKRGYTFLGWRLDDSTAYGIDQPGQSIAINVGAANTTLTYYAQWQAASSNNPPSAPTNARATKTSSSSATISWDAVPSATSYKVEYYAEASGTWKTSTDYKTKTATSFNSGGMTTQNSFTFRIYAVNAYGTSGYAECTAYMK